MKYVTRRRQFALGREPRRDGTPIFRADRKSVFSSNVRTRALKRIGKLIERHRRDLLSGWQNDRAGTFAVPRGFSGLPRPGFALVLGLWLGLSGPRDASVYAS